LPRLSSPRIADLEVEKFQLKDDAAESTEAISTLQGTVNAGIEDYELLLGRNKSLLAERNDFCYC
jgi:hypothetical protein